jgi:hypothetical protein
MKEATPALSTPGTATPDGIWLDEFLGPVVTQYMKREGLEAADWRGQPLASDEVAGLRRGIEAELVHVDRSDACLVLDAFSVPKRYRLFQNYDRGGGLPGKAWSWSWRECFTQIAFACELVSDHGWPSSQIALEVGALDLAAGVRPSSRPAILAEAKVHMRGQAGIEGMLAVFQELSGGNDAMVGQQVRVNATRKYIDLLRMQPRVFAAIAPEARQIFDVTYADERALLMNRDSPIGPGDLMG